MIGPRNTFSQQLHASKYRQRGESFDDYCVRYARTTADNEKHFRTLLDGLRSQAILPGGRQQRAIGYPFQTTAFNCYVGGTIPDTTEGIGVSVTEAMMTLRSGGGCGWDFGTIRPAGDPVRGLGDDAYSSGPVSFMGIWHAMCSTIRSAGERKGAMMGVLPVSHPDILTFIRAKRDQSTLTNFNISVGVTNKFMEAVDGDKLFPLVFDGRTYREVRALDLWSAIMENNWDYAEPGVLFTDTINNMNPLRYCETIRATNPCAEQPLPPNGACLLLSMNLVKFLVPLYSSQGSGVQRRRYEIDYDRLKRYVVAAVRACDNVFENTVFPLEAQKQEAMAKRRMGVGVTGTANALEVCGLPYASDGYIAEQSKVLAFIRDVAYETSVEMAVEKGSFPLFDADKWLASGFAKTLPDHIRDKIKRRGLRNGLLLSIAPTGTISLCADNVSSGIEPPYAIEVDRKVNTHGGQVSVALNDWAFEEHGVRGRTAMEVSPLEHVKVLCEAQKYVDSSISKTINVRGEVSGHKHPGSISFAEFKDVYRLSWEGGAKGCTTFNVNGKRMGIITESVSATAASDQDTVVEQMCTMDPVTGAKVCG